MPKKKAPKKAGRAPAKNAKAKGGKASKPSPSKAKARVTTKTKTKAKVKATVKPSAKAATGKRAGGKPAGGAKPKGGKPIGRSAAKGSSSKAGKVIAKAPAAGKGARRETVEGYIAGLGGWKARIAGKLRDLLHVSAPGSKESIKGSQPVYEVNGPYAYIDARDSSVNFGFWRGAELEDPRHLLEGDGGKMRHVKFVEGSVIEEDPLVALIQQAVVLNLAKGDPTREGANGI